MSVACVLMQSKYPKELLWTGTFLQVVMLNPVKLGIWYGSASGRVSKETLDLLLEILPPNGCGSTLFPLH